MPTLNMEFFKGCVRDAQKPILALIVLEAAWWALDYVPSLDFLLGDYLYIVRFALIIWAGYAVVKNAGYTIQGAAITGALAGLIVEIADFVLGLVLLFGYYSIDYAISDMVRWMLIGAVAGAVGYLIASNKKGSTDTSGSSPQTPPETEVR